MALLRVTPYGDPLLRRQSESIGEVDAELRRLVADMIETMHAAKGVGLAAPQVGVSKKLFVIDWSLLVEGGTDRAYLNPEVLESGGKLVTFEEGCLSFPQTTSDVIRHDWVRVKYLTLEGEEVTEELEDYPARVFQHELDHLFGILFIDRISSKARAAIKDNLQAILDGKLKPFDGATIATGEREPLPSRVDM